MAPRVTHFKERDSGARQKGRCHMTRVIRQNRTTCATKPIDLPCEFQVQEEGRHHSVELCRPSSWTWNSQGRSPFVPRWATSLLLGAQPCRFGRLLSTPRPLFEHLHGRLLECRNPFKALFESLFNGKGLYGLSPDALQTLPLGRGHGPTGPVGLPALAAAFICPSNRCRFESGSFDSDSSTSSTSKLSSSPLRTSSLCATSSPPRLPLTNSYAGGQWATKNDQECDRKWPQKRDAWYNIWV